MTLEELTHDAARLRIRKEKQPGRDRDEEEAELRERAQGALREAGVLAAPAAG